MKKNIRLLGVILIIALLITNTCTVMGAKNKNLGNWEIKSSMPTNRSSVGIVEVNGKVFAIGGNNENGALDIVEEYNPDTDSWTTKNSMPTARYGFAIAVSEEKIYVIGGTDNNTILDTVEEYNPSTDTWTERTSMPTPRVNLGGAEFGGKIYAIGGRQGFTDIASDKVEEYNPSTDTWTRKANMPTPRYGLAVTRGGNRLYAIGGIIKNVSNWANTVEEYDPSTNTWATKTSMTVGRQLPGALGIGNKVYIMGGVENGGYSDTVEEYSIESDTWTTKTSMPTKRSSLGLAEAGGKIYAIGGNNNDGLNRNELSTVEVLTSFTDFTSEPLNLIATPLKKTISLSWEPVSGAERYTILRSTTSSSVNITIANGITETSYIDANVEPGVTYYYVVRAIKEGMESADSNIASAMLEESNNRALLFIKLVDGNDKEYDLSMDEVNAFIDWYDNRGEGQGVAYYIFNKEYNMGPYISRKDYIAYDKIICFEVNEYLVE